MSHFLDYFSTQSAQYAKARPTYPSRLAAELVRLASPCDLVWDAGCGSGQLSVGLAEHADVQATDASAQQIAHAVAHERVNYAVAPSETSGLPDGSVDLCTVAQAAHWFDLDAYYREVRRVLRPGGVVALVSYARMYVTPAVDEAIMGHFYEDVLGPLWPPERGHVEDGYARLPFPFEPVPVPEIEMCLRWSREQLWGYVMSWSAVARIPSDRRESVLSPVYAALCAAWEDDLVLDVRWPLMVKAGRYTG